MCLWSKVNYAQQSFGPEGGLEIYQVINGRVIDAAGSPTSNLEFWRYCSDNPDAFPGLELLGVTEPEIVISRVNEQITGSIQVKTEYGVIVAPRNIDRSWDHFVVDGYWIPLDKDSANRFFGILEENNWDPDALGKGVFFRLTQALREQGFKVHIDEDVYAFFVEARLIPKISLLQGQAYDYQKIGIAWLCDYFENGLGALLCDEMGLGKTYQVMGLIAHLTQKSQSPILIVCPASLTVNWQHELAKFLPEVSVHTHLGPSRGFDAEELKTKNLVLTTYDLVVNDESLFKRVQWAVVICDEAQALKNRESKRHQAVSALSASSKVLVTGTPVENSLTDLWALSDIVAPGILGTWREFEALIDDTPAEAHEIGRRVSPLILRRNVLEVARDLPPLVEIEEPIIPSAAFSEFYELVRRGSATDGKRQSFLVVLTQLTQVCCYPGLLDPTFTDNLDSKFSRLAEILDELFELNTDKVIIFSTFTGSIDRLVAFINRRYESSLSSALDGRLQPGKRQDVIDAFNNSLGFKVLVINPKAGGTGLNITGANHVIHFNRQWNPQLERQATARAYRRKQTKTVFVHKFFYLGTVEQVINERLQHKERLAGAALENALAQEEDVMQARALLISPAHETKE